MRLDQSNTHSHGGAWVAVVIILALTMTTGCDLFEKTAPRGETLAFVEGRVQPVPDPASRPIAEIRVANTPCSAVTDSTAAAYFSGEVDPDGRFVARFVNSGGLTYQCVVYRARPSRADTVWTEARKRSEPVTFRKDAPYDTVDVGTIMLPDSLLAD